MTGRTAAEIEAAFLAACRLEIASLKPGNVHAYGDGHRMDVAMFEASAVASAPAIATRGARVGVRIERAMAASLAAAGCNTNLGIVLLCAPLARAAEDGKGPLRLRLDAVLDDLDTADAAAAFRAITAANPAGLGHVAEADVAAPPAVTLLQAMVLARGHDRIANAYATDFADVFDFALPALGTARLSASSPERAVTALHMSLLAQFPDTHIARKHGAAIAADVQRAASNLRRASHPAVDDEGFDVLLDFDRSLKQRGINPGTTADFVVATVFTERLLTANRAVKTV